MITIEPIRVEVESEDDGRILASVPDLPGVIAYGNTETEAVRKVKTIALQVLAEMIESGEEAPVAVPHRSDPQDVSYLIRRCEDEVPQRAI